MTAITSNSKRIVEIFTPLNIIRGTFEKTIISFFAISFALLQRILYICKQNN